MQYIKYLCGGRKKRSFFLLVVGVIVDLMTCVTQVSVTYSWAEQR